MGWFGGKDWNIVGIIFEKPDLYRVNANRGKGGEATTIRDNVKNHPRTLLWAVFDQKGTLLESGEGGGVKSIPALLVQKLTREIHTNTTIRQVLSMLEKGETVKVAKAMEWSGYPKQQQQPPLA
jgi:hypothetical protein